MVPRFGMYPTRIRKDCCITDKPFIKIGYRMKDEQIIQRMVCVFHLFVTSLVIVCDNHNIQPSRDEPKWSTVKFKLKKMSVIIHSWVSQVALVVKNLIANAGDIRDVGSIPGLERSPGEGHGSPLQYSCLEDPVDRGAWQAKVPSIVQCWAWLKRLSIQHSFLEVLWRVKSEHFCWGGKCVKIGVQSLLTHYDKQYLTVGW